MPKQRHRFWVSGELPPELKKEIEDLSVVSGWSISRIMTRAAKLGFEQAKVEALEDVKKHYERFVEMKDESERPG